MPNKYQSIVKNALTKYKNHAPRPGYPDGLFTSFRHSFAETSPITSLRSAVSDKDNAGAKEAIIQYLQNNPQNNHSFAAYLLDELVSQLPIDNWKQHNQRSVVFYQASQERPHLYRGDTRPPEVIFREGFKLRKKSKKMEDYAGTANLEYGVSTTKDKLKAKHYSNHIVHARVAGVPPTHIQGYVYVIDPRGLPGVDILETWQSRPQNRSNRLTQWFGMAQDKQEVNFAADIPASNILGYLKFEANNQIKLVGNAAYQPPVNATCGDEVQMREKVFAR